MFNLLEVGKKIASKRKELNMTQMELADKLGVTHQAISSWEKGLTMPDIAKLGDISKELDISIDYLLGVSTSSKLVEEIIENEENLKHAKIDEIKDIAPILKPMQVNKAISNLKEDKLNVDDIITLAPFLSEELVDKMLLDNEYEMNASQLCSIVPFVSKKAINKKATSVIVEDPSLLVSLAPFLDEEVLNKLVIANKNDLQNDIIISLAPFLSDETINEIFEDFEEVDFDLIVSLCPFASSETLSKLAAEKLKTKNISSLASIAPFIDEEAMGKLVLDFYTNETGKDIASLAPFIEEEMLLEIAVKIYNNHGLNSVLPIINFVDADEFGKKIKLTK